MTRLIPLLGALTGASYAQMPAPPAPTAPTPPAAAAPAATQAPGAAAGATLPRTAPPAGARVYIISPRNGATVHDPVVVRFGLTGMGVAPAGTKIDNTGHHHLLIDTDLKSLNLDAPLPATPDKVLHFGKGQTETSLTLPPGKHTLELLFADYEHMSFDPPLHSEKITITVH